MAYVMPCIPLQQQQQKASSLGTLAAKCLLKADIITNLSMGQLNSEKHYFKAFLVASVISDSHNKDRKLLASVLPPLVSLCAQQAA